MIYFFHYHTTLPSIDYGLCKVEKFCIMHRISCQLIERKTIFSAIKSVHRHLLSHYIHIAISLVYSSTTVCTGQASLSCRFIKPLPLLQFQLPFFLM